MNLNVVANEQDLRCMYHTIVSFLQFNMTPLMSAAMDGHDSVVELLLSRGADPNLRDNVSHFLTGIDVVWVPVFIL